MCSYSTKLIRFGDSLIVKLSDDLMEKLGLAAGDSVSVSLDDDGLIRIKKFDDFVNMDGWVILDGIKGLVDQFCKDHHVEKYVDNPEEIALMSQLLTDVVGNSLKDYLLAKNDVTVSLTEYFEEFMKKLTRTALSSFFVLKNHLKAAIYFDNFDDVTATGDYAKFRKVLADETFDLKKQIKERYGVMGIMELTCDLLEMLTERDN